MCWCCGGGGDTNNTWRIQWLGVEVVSSMCAVLCCGLVWSGVGATGAERELRGVLVSVIHSLPVTT